MNASESKRRSSNTLAVIALFKAHPLAWIGWRELAEVGGACAWRSRVADARRIVTEDGGRIAWNNNVRKSAYMWIPHTPLARDASEYKTQESLFR